MITVVGVLHAVDPMNISVAAPAGKKFKSVNAELVTVGSGMMLGIRDPLLSLKKGDTIDIA